MKTKAHTTNEAVRNVINAVEAYVVSVIQYSAGMVDRINDDLIKMDRKTRKTLKLSS